MSEIMPLLVQKTGLSIHDIGRIIANAPSRYKVFRIKKRSGGEREIAQPAREVKILQEILLHDFLSTLPIHGSATAYREGMSTKNNALPHAGRGPILKLDFSEFFPSIGAHHWIRYCNAQKLIPDEKDRWITSRLFFYRRKGQTTLRLSIGAPTSPMISNILMFEFDSAVSEAVGQDKVTYTRYADDLTFSASRTGYLNAVRSSVDRVIGSVPWPDLKINESKTVVATTKYRREVTGLILANDGRVTVGRDKKRELRAAIHYFTLGRLETKDVQRLAGLIAYVHAVEPSFLNILRAHYGAEVIASIQRVGAKSAANSAVSK